MMRPRTQFIFNTDKIVPARGAWADDCEGREGSMARVLVRSGGDVTKI